MPDRSADQDKPAEAPSLLTRLPHAARQLWTDPVHRHRTLAELRAAVEQGDDATADELLRSVDDAIRRALEALQLPRRAPGATRILYLEGLAGHKHRDCDVELGFQVMDDEIRHRGRPDTVFRTWVHESLHGRLPARQGYLVELQRTPGYEEGLVEALTRLVLAHASGFGPMALSYDYYVAAYHALASALDLDSETILRRLWESPPGAVRDTFSGVIGALARQRPGQPASRIQDVRLRAAADKHFDRSNRTRPLSGQDAERLAVEWREVFGT